MVDDNVSSAQSLAMVLKLDGHEVQVTHDGGLALEAVRRFRPEVVLMDIGLPGMDGYEVARRLRQDAELAAGIALLVAVTGYAEDEARRRSREAGFDHHLVKPVDPDGVLASWPHWNGVTRPQSPIRLHRLPLNLTTPRQSDLILRWIRRDCPTQR